MKSYAATFGAIAVVLITILGYFALAGLLVSALYLVFWLAGLLFPGVVWLTIVAVIVGLVIILGLVAWFLEARETLKRRGWKGYWKEFLNS